MQDIFYELFIHAQGFSQRHDRIQGEEEGDECGKEGIEKELVVDTVLYFLDPGEVTALRIYDLHEIFVYGRYFEIAVEIPVFVEYVLFLVLVFFDKIRFKPLTLDGIGTEFHLDLYLFLQLGFIVSEFVPEINGKKHFQQDEKNEKTL